MFGLIRLSFLPPSLCSGVACIFLVEARGLFRHGSIGFAKEIDDLEHVSRALVTIVVSCGTLPATPRPLPKTS